MSLQVRHLESLHPHDASAWPPARPLEQGVSAAFLSKRPLYRFTANEAVALDGHSLSLDSERFSMKSRLTAAAMTVLLSVLGTGVALAESPVEKSIRQTVGT